MSPGDLDIIGWIMMWTGAAIVGGSVIVDILTMPMPDWHQPSWSPEGMTISEMVDNLEQQEAADNAPLTLHESLNSWCGPLLPHHHPTITTEGTITNG